MPYRVPRVQVIPQPDDQVSIQVDGHEVLRWHAAARHARPFFFPVIGPSGRSITRMGHPADPSHDHHRSFWWGHQNLGGVNFWEEKPTIPGPQIRQETWLHYQDDEEEAGLAVRLAWIDAHKVKLMQQDLFVIYRPLVAGEAWIEMQTTFTTPLEHLSLVKTNFGFLGLRVATSLSALFGAGKLTNSEGAVGEKNVFAKPARWLDYSGPITNQATEGVTWFDHPRNLRHPTSWHARDDGWMSAAFNLNASYDLYKGQPLVLRYGFHIHSDEVNPRHANDQFEWFATRPAWELTPQSRPARWRLQRLPID